MNQESGWNIDVRSLSNKELAEALDLLKNSKHKDVHLTLKAELIRRCREKNLSNVVIVDYLLFGVAVWNKRKDIAEDWADILGLTVEEFLKIAKRI